MRYMVVPWSEITARKWAEVGKPIAAHEFCKRLLTYDVMQRPYSGDING